MSKFLLTNTAPTCNIVTEADLPFLMLSAENLISVPEPTTECPSDDYILVADKDENNEWFTTWILKTEYSTAINNDSSSYVIKQLRNNLLAASDWTQHSDVSKSVSSAWQPYREALRHITKQEGFPNNVIWPTKPTEFKEVVDEPITPGPAGKDGKDGKDGVDGKDGLPGPKGETGAQGPAGPAGKDGVSITSAVVNSTGNLIITKSDGTTVDAGKVSTTSTTTTSGPVVVGSAPNPFAPIVVTAPPGYKAANLDDGVELTLDTLAVTLNTGNPRSLLMRVTTGTMSVRISGEIYWCPGNYQGTYEAKYWTGDTLTTTNQQIFPWSFPWAGDKAVYNVIDQTNRRLYRITLIIGAGYKKNFIVMERLV